MKVHVYCLTEPFLLWYIFIYLTKYDYCNLAAIHIDHDAPYSKIFIRYLLFSSSKIRTLTTEAMTLITTNKSQLLFNFFCSLPFFNWPSNCHSLLLHHAPCSSVLILWASYIEVAAPESNFSIQLYFVLVWTDNTVSFSQKIHAMEIQKEVLEPRAFIKVEIQ